VSNARAGKRPAASDADKPLADRLGENVDLHYTHIGRYERGVSRSSADAVQRLANAFGVSADYLMEGSTRRAK